MTDETLAPAGRFRDLAKQAIDFGGGRLVWIGLVSALAAVAEGAGLLLLLPILEALGVSGSSNTLLGFGGWLGDFASLEIALVVYVAVIMAAAGLIAARGVLVNRLRLAFVDDLRSRLHAALVSARWQVVARYKSADVMHVLGIEVGRSGEGIQFLLRVVGWGLELPVVLAVALALSPELTALALICAVLLVAAAVPIDRMTHRIARRLGPTGRGVLNAIGEDISALSTIKVFAAERRRIAHFRDHVAALRRDSRKHENIRAAGRALAMSGGAVAVALSVWISLEVLRLALAETLVLVVALARLLPLASRVQEGWRQVLVALPAHATATNLLEELRAAAEDIPDEAPAINEGEKPAVALRDVTFDYIPGADHALQAVTADLGEASHVAIVGASGAGKSTMAHILVGLLVPSDGAVLIRGEPLDETSVVAWRRRTALVGQDPVLFNESIADNLRIAKPNAEDRELWDCLAKAGAAFVKHLPEGLETIVGERGARLSGGEKQRIALARALLAKPALLVLDEPTSALDPAGEAAIIQVLRELSSETRIVTISHRPALARAADHVIMLDGGQVLAQGAWADLGDTERTAIEALGLG